MSEGWTPSAWPVGQLTDAELTKGIAHYEAALEQPDVDASVRATVAARLEEYQTELDVRRKARRARRIAAGYVW